MNPHELAERRVELSAKYSQLTEEYKSILKIKALTWRAIRSLVTTDKAAEREWEASDDGIREMELRLDLKRLEKEMSGIRLALDVMTGEARNQY